MTARTTAEGWWWVKPGLVPHQELVSSFDIPPGTGYFKSESATLVMVAETVVAWGKRDGACGC